MWRPGYNGESRVPPRCSVPGSEDSGRGPRSVQHVVRGRDQVRVGVGGAVRCELGSVALDLVKIEDWRVVLLGPVALQPCQDQPDVLLAALHELLAGDVRQIELLGGRRR